MLYLYRAQMHDLRARSQVGLIVSKKVGNAVTRNRVKRQLRHIIRPAISSSQEPLWCVIRALPASAHSTQLDYEVTSAYESAVKALLETP